MNSLNISIFGNKIFLEIINEIKLFPEFKIAYYEDLTLCLKDSERQNLLAIIFADKSNIDFLTNKKENNFPSILITDSLISKSIFSGELTEQLNMPFTVQELKRKIISLIAKNEFKKNSLIQLEDYIIDKNERKIKKII